MVKGEEDLQIPPWGGSAGPGRARGIGEQEQAKCVKGIKCFRIDMQSSQLRGWKKAKLTTICCGGGTNRELYPPLRIKNE